VYALLSPFAGFLADRFNRSKVIIWSLLVWSVVTWMTAHAKTFEQLLVTRALMGISEACYIPAAFALIVDYHRGTTRSLACGIHASGVSFGSGLSGLGGLRFHSISLALSVSSIAWCWCSRCAMRRKQKPPAPRRR
jgi:MFS family permease